MRRLPPDDGRNDARMKSPARSTAAELLVRAMGDVRELVAVEVGLARNEIERQAREVAVAAGLLAGGAAMLVLCLSMALVALVLAVGATPAKALAAAAALFGCCTILVVLGARRLPKKALPRTQRRVKRDVEEVKEVAEDLKEAVNP